MYKKCRGACLHGIFLFLPQIAIIFPVNRVELTVIVKSAAERLFNAGPTNGRYLAYQYPPPVQRELFNAVTAMLVKRGHRLFELRTAMCG